MSSKRNAYVNVNVKLNVESDLLNILTPSPTATPGHDLGVTLHRVEGVGLDK